MAWTKPEPLLPEVDFKEFVEARILNIETMARDAFVNSIDLKGELSKINIRLARIEDLLKKRKA